MTTILITKVVMDDLLFGTCTNPVTVSKIEDTGDHWSIEIDGVDVPKTERATAIVDIWQNRAGQRFCTMRFEADE